MSYEVSIDESEIRVLKAKSALAALKLANRKKPVGVADPEDFVPSEVEDARTLAQALEACGLQVEKDDGKIAKLFFDGIRSDIARLGRLFHLLAPFIGSGSFVQVRGEDGARWEFRFRKGMLRVDEEGPEDD